jgi:CBS domain containing-hemolysin-like protein
MPASSGPHATEDDIRAIVSLSRQAGGIQPHEEMSIRNILSLDRKHVHDIMTPRTVVFSLPADLTVEEAYEKPDFWHYSRIPVFGEGNEDIVGIVMRRRVLQEVAADREGTRLADIMQPVHYALESQTLDRVLFQFLDARVHLFVVLDEYGGLAGVVSLEDVLEEILGREIVDESDRVTDLRELARERRDAAIKANQ